MLRNSHRIFSLLCIILCCVHFGFAQVAPYEDDQSWNEVLVVKPFNKTRELIITGQFRLGGQFTRPVEEQLGGTLAFKIKPYLTLAPAYFLVGQQPAPGRNVIQHRMVFIATGTARWRRFTITDRNQLERRFVVDNPDSIVYRNRLQVEHPFHIGDFKFRAFAWNEIRYSNLKLTTGKRLGWFRNRFALGVGKQITKRFSLDLFYLQQNDGISRPGDINAMGTSFRVTL